MEEITRRRFLEFMGRGAAFVAGGALIGPLSACTTASIRSKSESRALQEELGFTPISPSFEDKVVLAQGFTYAPLITWGDRINKKGERFGYNNDYLAYFPFSTSASSDDALLWVNHEYPVPLFVSGYQKGQKKTRKQVEMEQESVGGSIIRIKKGKDGKWSLVKDDSRNRRITAKTPIPIVSQRAIKDAKVAIGTMSNCAGGVTPWGTVLTCEENYQDYYGETNYDQPSDSRIHTSYAHHWEEHFDYPPEHYGWVVEVNPRTGDAKKLTGLGRFAHECATTVLAKDGRTVVYSGDDANDECIYKFISDRPGSLERGTLYVANTEKGQWIPLDLKKNPSLHEYFKDQTDLLIQTRKAAHLVGGTPQDRPEDIDRDPQTGAMLIALTNNKPKKNYHGSLLKIEETGNDPLSLSFKASTFLMGGEENGFACPDNMAFDPAGNLWFTTDMSGTDIGTAPYKLFGNNGLFFVPLSGPGAGRPVQVASAPNDAEFTGPCFSPDGKTLFLSVQHPGENSKSLDQMTSHWPGGGTSVPKPTVIAISGPALEKIVTRRS